MNHYPKGVAPDADLDEFTSLAHMLRSSCRRFAELAAYSSMGAQLTFAELDRESLAFAAWLQKALGPAPGRPGGDHDAQLLQYPVAMFGALRAGMVVVNVNPQYTVAELEHQLLDSGAAAVVVLENFAQTLQQVMARNPSLQLAVVTTEVGDMFPVMKELITNAVVKYVKKMVPAWTIPDTVEFNAALRAGHALSLDDVPLAHARHRLPAVHGRHHWRGQGRDADPRQPGGQRAATGGVDGTGLRDGEEIFVCPLPLYHVYAAELEPGVPEDGRHDRPGGQPARHARLPHDLKAHPFTAMIGVNTLYRALLDAPASRRWTPAA